MPPGEDGGDQGGGVRSDLLGPVDEAVGRPIAHPAVLLGHVLGRGGVAPRMRRADVAGNALSAMEALDGAGRQPDIELAADERVRDRVVVPVDLDVVVGGHPDGLPLGEDVGAVGQRAQGRTVELLELRAPRPRELAERPGVEPFEQLGDPGTATRSGSAPTRMPSAGCRRRHPLHRGHRFVDALIRLDHVGPLARARSE